MNNPEVLNELAIPENDKDTSYDLLDNLMEQYNSDIKNVSVPNQWDRILPE